MPDLFVYRFVWASQSNVNVITVLILLRYACITYDGFKDLYKLYIDGVKVASGPFSGDDPIAVVR